MIKIPLPGQCPGHSCMLPAALGWRETKKTEEKREECQKIKKGLQIYLQDIVDIYLVLQYFLCVSSSGHTPLGWE